MKIKQLSKKFAPIQITLETQEEVNAMFAIANYSGLTESISLISFFDEISGYETENYEKFHLSLDKFIKENIKGIK